MKKILSTLTAIVFVYMSSLAQWTNVIGTAQEISCGSATNVVVVANGSIFKRNFTTNVWDLMAQASSYTSIGTAADGTTWARSSNTIGQSNLIKFSTNPIQFATHSNILGLLDNIAVKNNSVALGSVTTGVNNIYTTSSTANTFALLANSTNFAAKKISIANNGSIYAIDQSTTGNNVFFYSSGWVSSLPSIAFRATDIAVNDNQVPIAVSNGNLYFAYNGAWVLDATAPQGQVTRITSAADGTLYILTNEASNNIYRNTYTNMVCSNTSSTATNTTPVANLTICAGLTTTLTATGSGTLNWYDVPNGGTALASGTSFSTPVITAQKTFYVANFTSNCESIRTPITVNLDAGSLTNTTASQWLTGCEGLSSVLSVSGNGTVNWYASSTGGSSIGTGLDFTTPPLVSNVTYYAQSSTGTCPRLPISITVNPAPANPTSTTPAENLLICNGSSTSLSVAAAPAGILIYWSMNPQGGNTFSTASTINTGALNATTTFYVGHAVVANGCNSQLIPITVVTTAPPASPVNTTNATDLSVCNSSSTTLSVSSAATVNWFNVATGGTAIGTGLNYTTPNLTTNTTYYAEAANGNCKSTRTPISVATITSPTNASGNSGVIICSGSSTIITVNSSGLGTVNWFATSTSTTPIATGLSFTTPILTTNTTYYVEETVGTCTTTRTPITVGINASTLYPNSSPVPTIYWPIQAPSQNQDLIGAIGLNPSSGITTGTDRFGNANSAYEITAKTQFFNFNSGINSPATISFWYYFAGTGGGYSTLLSNQTTQHPVLLIDDLSRLSMWSSTGTVAGATTTLTAGQWYHIVLSRNGSNGMLYLNGNQVATATNISQQTIDRIGNNRNGFVTQGCLGKFDDIKVFSAVYAPNQITAPTVQFGLQPNYTVCEGASFSLNPTFYEPNLTYSWSLNGSPIGTNTNSLVIPSFSGNSGILTLNAYNSCNYLQLSTALNVNTAPVNNTPTSNLNICSGNATSLSVTSAGTINWYATATGGTVLSTGANFTTPVLTANTSYFAGNINGNCTSVRTEIAVNVGTNSVNTINEVNCGVFSLNNQNYTTSGTYTQNLQNAAGCDSTITLNLVVNQPTTSVLTESSCVSFTLNSQTYTSSGIYTQNLQNVAGCDSTITLNLTITIPTSSTINASNCGSGFTLNNQTYTTAGTYTQTLTNVAGCDSTITINLTVGAPNTSTLTEENCGSFTLNNQTYNTSGTFTQTLQNVSGCDSVITLNLTILTPTSSVINASECASYTLNGTTYSTSGTFVQTIQNAAGCDSTITLNLTIQSNTGTATISACDSYTWINGTTYTSSNNTATYTLTNVAGCDSVVTLNLTIATINNATTVNGTTISATQSGANYQWINCENNTPISGANSQTFTATTNGSYAVVISTGSCVDTSTCTTFNTIGLDENVKATFAIFPNPATENVTISNIEVGSTVVLVDVTGKVISKIVTSSTAINVETSNFTPGVYFVTVSGLNGTQKLVIE